MSTAFEALVMRDILANRPAAAIPGRLFYDTTNSILYRDTGGAWQSVEGAGGGGGGATIGTGTDAAKPSPGTSGDLYLPNDGVQIYRSDGVAQRPWGVLYPFTAPDDSLFAWRNQGGASVDTTHGGIFLLAPASAATSLRIRELAYPATPFTLTAAISIACSGNSGSAGICLVDSASGKLEIIWLANYDLEVDDYASVTSFSAQIGLSGGNGGTGGSEIQWIQVEDTGAGGGNLRIWRHSLNGYHWQQFASVSNTAYLTPNKLGLFASSNDANFQAGVTLLSWKIT